MCDASGESAQGSQSFAPSGQFRRTRIAMHLEVDHPPFDVEPSLRQLQRERAAPLRLPKPPEPIARRPADTDSFVLGGDQFVQGEADSSLGRRQCVKSRECRVGPENRMSFHQTDTIVKMGKEHFAGISPPHREEFRMREVIRIQVCPLRGSWKGSGISSFPAPVPLRLEFSLSAFSIVISEQTLHPERLRRIARGEDLGTLSASLPSNLRLRFRVSQGTRGVA